MIWKRVKNFLTIPPDIREEFYSSCLRKNKTSFVIVGMIIYLTEIFNVVRVIFMSKSGLTSHNNRVYFGMYCVLLAVATIYLYLQHLFRSLLL